MNDRAARCRGAPFRGGGQATDEFGLAKMRREDSSDYPPEEGVNNGNQNDNMSNATD